jgi:hypothetical protein
VAAAVEAAGTEVAAAVEAGGAEEGGGEQRAVPPGVRTGQLNAPLDSLFLHLIRCEKKHVVLFKFRKAGTKI